MSKRAAKDRSGGRMIAEWTTLGISVLLVAGVTSFLIYEALQEHPEAVAAHVQARLDRVQQIEGQYVLPVEIKNPSRRTLRDLKIELISGEDRQEFRLDYLGQGASETIYFYCRSDPRGASLQVRAVNYR